MYSIFDRDSTCHFAWRTYYPGDIIPSCTIISHPGAIKSRLIDHFSNLILLTDNKHFSPYLIVRECCPSESIICLACLLLALEELISSFTELLGMISTTHRSWEHTMEDIHYSQNTPWKISTTHRTHHGRYPLLTEDENTLWKISTTHRTHHGRYPLLTEHTMEDIHYSQNTLWKISTTHRTHHGRYPLLTEHTMEDIHYSQNTLWKMVKAIRIHRLYKNFRTKEA